VSKSEDDAEKILGVMLKRRLPAETPIKAVAAIKAKGATREQTGITSNA